MHSRKSSVSPDRGRGGEAAAYDGIVFIFNHYLIFELSYPHKEQQEHGVDDDMCTVWSNEQWLCTLIRQKKEKSHLLSETVLFFKELRLE